jgi:DNA-directed RNA polymerase specialized sigma24 family protein
MQISPKSIPPKRRESRIDEALPEALQAEQDLLERLRTAGFEGAATQHLEAELWRYGWRCLLKWMKDGSIAARCKAKGVRLKCLDQEVTELQRNAQLREDLAAAAVGEAIMYFMEYSLKLGYWKPCKGASMRTYFVHDCLYKFRDAFNAWARPRRRQLEALAGTVLDLGLTQLGFEERVELRDAVRRILQRSPAEAAAIAAMLYHEPCTQKEIGAQLSLSVRSVEGYLRRMRSLGREMQRRGDIEVPPRICSITTTKGCRR